MEKKVPSHRNTALSQRSRNPEDLKLDVVHPGFSVPPVQCSVFAGESLKHPSYKTRSSTGIIAVRKHTIQTSCLAEYRQQLSRSGSSLLLYTKLKRGSFAGTTKKTQWGHRSAGKPDPTRFRPWQSPFADLATYAKSITYPHHIQGDLPPGSPEMASKVTATVPIKRYIQYKQHPKNTSINEETE